MTEQANRSSPPELSYIALASRDPEQLGRFLCDQLRLAAFEFCRDGDDTLMAYRAGRTALLVLPLGHDALSGDTAGVDHIAVAGGADEMDNLDPDLMGSRRIGPGGARQIVLDRRKTCGVDLRFSQTVPLPPVCEDVVKRIDHIGIASADNGAAKEFFCSRIGALYESQQTDVEVTTTIESFTSDKYGPFYHSRSPDVIGGLNVLFLTIGDLELEFLQDIDPAREFEMHHGAAGTTKQDRSAIGRFVAKRGGGLHHVAFSVDNIDDLLSSLAEADVRLIDKVGRPGSRCSRIGFVHPGSTGGVLVHFVERREIEPCPS